MSAFKKFTNALQKKGYSKESAGAIAASAGDKKYGRSNMKNAAKRKISVKEWLKSKK
jgi:uncharacterized membrane-anchored protein